MINLLDRLLVRSYLKAYLICLVSLLSLFIVVDLFTNLDDFIEQQHGLLPVLKHIVTYYGYRSTQIFDRLCEAIILLAATFTVALMQRNNELLPLLSAGVPTRRVVRPILYSACVMLGLSVLNQEVLIPRVATYLYNPRNDPAGNKDIPVNGAYEPNGIHIEGRIGNRKDQVIHEFFVVIPESMAGSLVSLSAAEAHYIPPAADQPHSGGWLMTGTKPALIEGWSSPILQIIDPGKYFLKTEQVDFDTITRGRGWYYFCSTAQLSDELSRPDSTRLSSMAVLFHMRMTRPILGIILVVMGLSVILRDQNRHVFISAGMCLGVCALFFAAQFACQQLGEHNYVSPALAAWLPVLSFGPLSFAMFDAVHT
jgi:lipopolysaccharide export system permease protein